MNTQANTAAGDAPFRTHAVPVCPICAHAGGVLHHSITDRAYGVAGRWQTMRCSHCHTGWLNPVPVADDLAACYVGGYYTHDASPAPSMGSSKPIVFMRAAVLSVQKGYRHLQPATQLAPVAGSLLMLIPLVRRRASFNLGDMVMPFRKGGRLLEIGCGSGSYLALMRMLGWTVWGIEPDPVAAEVAAKIAGCDVHIGTIEDAPFEPGSFDAVVSNHVIEHVYDPASFVSSAARLLSKGGLIVVRTPNFQSLGHRFFGADWFSLDPPRHLCLFTPTSLRSLFENSGLLRRVRTTTITAGSRLAIQRRYAVRETGSFLGTIKPSSNARGAELLFRVAEALGNSVFHWGEEIQCTALRA
jgi:2-polyprenyl-3-methyl-5-hydroxy-6-metoxy-1,4-benzoquinol methylase